MAVKDMAASILTRLKTQAKETGLTYQMCLQLFCQEEFLRKIEASRYSENFILKGGMFLYTITEFAGRPTRDIDFMIRWISNDTENMNQIMEEICTANTGNDFIRIEVLASENITEEKEYHGVKTNSEHISRMSRYRSPLMWVWTMLLCREQSKEQLVQGLTDFIHQLFIPIL